MLTSATRKESEGGVALILAMLAILILSVLAASIIFLSQTETWTTLDYRLTTQSRYAAEAGVQRTMNWILNNYTPPTTFTSYDMTKYPVQYSSNPVVLSAVSGVSSNYPDSTVSSAYNSALSNQSMAGLTGVSFSTYATLLRMTGGPEIGWLPGGTASVPQTWQITSQGNIAGVPSAQVQVVATYDRKTTQEFMYGRELSRQRNHQLVNRLSRILGNHSIDLVLELPRSLRAEPYSSHHKSKYFGRLRQPRNSWMHVYRDQARIALTEFSVWQSERECRNTSRSERGDLQYQQPEYEWK